MRPESSPKSLKCLQTHHRITKVPSTSVSNSALQGNQKTRQNHSEHVDNKHQKHFKICPEHTTLDDKYDLALQTKSKNKIKLNQAKGDLTFQLWDQQTEEKFCFIPLGPLVLSQSDNKINMGSDPIKLYDITRDQNTFHFLSTQIQVPSQSRHLAGTVTGLLGSAVALSN